LTAQFTAAIEAAIRRSPREWVWWHERWRRRPTDDDRS
jgi:KDO2-lipid IV(A) lauroyltransferase